MQMLKKRYQISRKYQEIYMLTVSVNHPSTKAGISCLIFCVSFFDKVPGVRVVNKSDTVTLNGPTSSTESRKAVLSCKVFTLMMEPHDCAAVSSSEGLHEYHNKL